MPFSLLVFDWFPRELTNMEVMTTTATLAADNVLRLHVGAMDYLPKKAVSRVFDIRNIIDALAVYGALLTIAGFAPGLVASHDDAAGSGNKVDL
jgi:hypothetical protein